jgi:hypothetical protein
MMVEGVGGVEAVLGTPLVVIESGGGAGDESDDELDETGDELFGDGGDVRS